MIKEFKVGFSRTVNMQNFNSVRIEAGLVIDVNEGDDFEQLKGQAQVELRALIEDTWNRQVKDHETKEPRHGKR